MEANILQKINGAKLGENRIIWIHSATIESLNEVLANGWIVVETTPDHISGGIYCVIKKNEHVRL